MKCETCGKWAGAHATLPGQPTDHLCNCRPSNPNACQHCGHKQNPDSGWCYMFRMEPNGPCAQHTIGVAAAMAHRLQVARRMLDSMKPNTERSGPP